MWLEDSNKSSMFSKYRQLRARACVRQESPQSFFSFLSLNFTSGRRSLSTVVRASCRYEFRLLSNLMSCTPWTPHDPPSAAGLSLVRLPHVRRRRPSDRISTDARCPPSSSRPAKRGSFFLARRPRQTGAELLSLSVHVSYTHIYIYR